MQFVQNLEINKGGPVFKQIPCIEGKGAPTTETVGAVGLFYMDTDSDNGDLYKCTAKNDGVYSWKPVDKEAVRYTKQNLTPEQKAQARENIEAASAEDVGYLKNYVTPEMFGAVCDGVTDDSTALQAACDTGEPVFIAKNIAIAKSVEVKNSVTIKDGAVVYVTADVHGFVMRNNGMTIRGGRITHKLSDPASAIIHIDGARYCNVQNVVVDYDSNSVVQSGTGVLIQPESANSCFNTVKDCYFFNLKYGVRIARTEAHWVTCNYIKSTFNFCSTAIYATETGSNTFDIEGQAGDNTKGGFNANIYIEGTTSDNNKCYLNMVDTGNPDRNQYDLISHDAGLHNFVSGAVAERIRGQYLGGINHYMGSAPAPIPGVYDLFANAKATFEPIGNGYASSNGVFNYPKKKASDLLIVKNVISDNDGVLITIPMTQGVDQLYMYFSSNSAPQKVEVSIDGVDFKEVNWVAGYISLSLLFKNMAAATNIYIRMLGACSYVNPGLSVTQFECLALAATPYRIWSNFNDAFTGIRPTGGNMTGDLNFAKGKGVVLTDANGVAYRLTVGTDGTLTATAI